MNESASGVTLKPSLDNYYRWIEPDSDITVCLNPEAMHHLQLEVLRRIHPSSHMGSEVGGLLLGRTQPDEGRTLIFVDDFELVPCEYRHERFYVLTAKDAVNFEAALARQRPRVVGYCRSHNRDGLFLSPDDLQLVRRHFRGTSNLFLLIKTLPNRACTAGFFFRKDGRIQAEFTGSEVPLIPVSVSHAGESSSPAETVDDIIALRPPTALPPANMVRSRDVSRRLIYGMAVTGAAAVVTFSVARYWETRAPQPVHGKDGMEIPLASADAVPASPTAVRAPALTVKQSVPNVQGRPANSPEAALPQPRNTTATPLGGQPQLPDPVPAPLPTSATTNVRSIGHGETSPPAASAELPPNITPASPPEVTIAPAVLPPAVSLSENPGTPASGVQRTDPLGRDVPSAAMPSPATPAAVTPAAPAQTFIGPQIIHQVSPAVPRGVGPMITTDVQVDVVVGIDAKGKVTGARIASTKGAAARLLTIEVLKAAQLFRFQPARENNRNVASSMVLTFRFARSAK